MTTIPWKQAGLIMALVGVASFVQAQEAGSERPSREEMIAKYDTNGDGQLSEAERATMREARGGKGGKRKGPGSEEGPAEGEVKGERKGRGGPEGENGQDQQGSRQRPSREEMIAKYDTDGDGQLGETERAAMREARGGKGGKRKGPGSEEAPAEGEVKGERKGRGGPEGEGGKQRPSREEMIAKYDTNGDGQLNEEERKALRQARSAQQQ